jgi:hypothetical protein
MKMVLLRGWKRIQVVLYVRHFPFLDAMKYQVLKMSARTCNILCLVTELSLL